MIKVHERKMIKVKKSKASRGLTRSSKNLTKGLDKNLSRSEKAIDSFANLGYK